MRAQKAQYDIHKRSRTIEMEKKHRKFYYAPIASVRTSKFSLNVRRANGGALVLARRPREAVEYQHLFLFIESPIVSWVLYWTAKLTRTVSTRRVAIYFEKNANGAEEGTFELAKMASRKSGSKHYFILNKTSPYFTALQDDPLVVPNFTLKAYWLIFRANVSITTEAPLHVNILRGNNRPLRLALYEKSFVFLQHGITYLKRQGKASAFVAGKEAEPDYIVTGSDKESAIMSDMLNIPAERMLQSGLIIFDHIKYGHITQKSEDIATIMLTWRPYEEHLTDFSKSSYYYEVNKVFATLTRYLPKENIRIVAHPRMKQLLESTDMKNSMWHGSIEEGLSETKLLVTDYSSVCYNTFYRGGGVIFFLISQTLRGSRQR